MTEQAKPIPTLEEKRESASEGESVFKTQAESLKVKESSASSEAKIKSPIEAPDATPLQAEEPIRELKSLVFEITYLADPITKKSGLAYTEIQPEFDNLGYVEVKKAFGCLVLREVVLNREVVERKCRQFLAQPDFTIDCKQGVLIKAVEAQPWMFQQEHETKQEFDKAVLDAFRAIQAEVAKELHAAEIEKAKILAEQERKRLMGNDETIPVRSPVYTLQPGDEGYNPNNDPKRRQKPMPVNSEQLNDLT